MHSPLLADDTYAQLRAKLWPRLSAFIQEISATKDDPREVLILLGMGGTFQSKPAEGGGLSPAGTLASTLDVLGVPLLPDRYNAHLFEVMNLDSSQLTVDHWRVLAEVITELINAIPKTTGRPFHGGFVVTHGTDTMEYAAAFLWHMLGDGVPVPVVLTGAQTPVHYRYSDARQNLENALLTVQLANEQNVRRVMLVCGSKLIAGNKAKKVHDTSAEAFAAFDGSFYLDFNQRVKKDALAFHPSAKQVATPFKPFTAVESRYANIPITEVHSVAPERFQRSLYGWSCFIVPLFGAATCPVQKADILLAAHAHNKVPILRAAFPSSSTRMGTYTAGAVLANANIPYVNATEANIRAAALVAISRYNLQEEEHPVWGTVFQTAEMCNILTAELKQL